MLKVRPKIYDIRMKAGLAEKELAKLAGTTPSVISRSKMPIMMATRWLCSGELRRSINGLKSDSPRCDSRNSSRQRLRYRPSFRNRMGQVGCLNSILQMTGLQLRGH